MDEAVLRIIKVLAGVLAGLLCLGYLGLKVPPKSFRFDQVKLDMEEGSHIVMQIPKELQRYAERTLLGEDGVSKVENSVVWGRAKIHVKGLWMPARFITYYESGEGFFRYIEITWFGIPIMNGYDLYYDGTADFYIAGQKETGEKIRQGQNIALWAETIWSPSVYFTDKRLKWEKKENNVFELKIPYNDEEDTIQFFMNDDTGLIEKMEAKRYKGQSNNKVPWEIDILEWKEIDGVFIPSYSSVKWDDEKEPWSYWDIKGVSYNVEISVGFKEEMAGYLGEN